MTEQPPTIPRARLPKATTTDLIAQYHKAIASHAGRYTNTAPRQKRINYIVDLIAARADAGDPTALAWYEH